MKHYSDFILLVLWLAQLGCGICSYILACRAEKRADAAIKRALQAKERALQAEKEASELKNRLHYSDDSRNDQ